MTLVRPVTRMTWQALSTSLARCFCPWRAAMPRHCHFWNEHRALLEDGLAAGPKPAARRRELARVLRQSCRSRAHGQSSRPRPGKLDPRHWHSGRSDRREPLSRLTIRLPWPRPQIALGRVLSASPETLDQAVAALTKGIELRQTITREHPDRVDQVHELALDLGELAAIEQKAGRLEPAVEAESQAWSSSSSLIGDFPTSFPTRETCTLRTTWRARFEASRVRSS